MTAASSNDWISPGPKSSRFAVADSPPSLMATETATVALVGGDGSPSLFAICVDIPRRNDDTKVYDPKTWLISRPPVHAEELLASDHAHRDSPRDTRSMRRGSHRQFLARYLTGRTYRQSKPLHRSSRLP